MPSKPGYETSPQAKPGRHPEVAWSRRRDQLPTRSSGLHAARLSLTQFVRFAAHPPDGWLIAASRQAGSLTGQLARSLPDLDIGAGAYGPSTEVRTHIDIPP